ncbi:TIGR03089 family protein [Actinoplanes sp. KI2]|uniref:TIGR03089 family protein n=1 Tax=Actinoplanes sp. KI2 TaxID=2983315 RepID=UPI0021D5AFEE|nr:TIGR03089 family protein [Actinoplanes sp. KI2]MCU7727387.1 TIGR03089 family protein [Actinoplanes sp. KI2]
MTAELLTYYDDATGERAGLSAAELGEWSAATAALLTAECGLASGDRVGVLLPPHWQTAVVLLGAWSAGLAVSFRGWATAGLTPAAPLDATFVERRRVGSWLDDVPPARHQFVLTPGPPVADAPAGYRDFLTSVRPHLGAAAPAWSSVLHGSAVPDGSTFGEYGAMALEIASVQGITRGDRVLIDTAAASEQPLMWLLAPLSAGASIVLCANLAADEVAARAAAEGATRVFPRSMVH